MAEFGRLDILVNNAAMQRTHQDISEISDEEWDATFRTNIYAQFYLCQEAVQRMQAGAAIVNTTSINAKDPSPSLLRLRDDEGRDRELHVGSGAECWRRAGSGSTRSRPARSGRR